MHGLFRCQPSQVHADSGYKVPGKTTKQKAVSAFQKATAAFLSDFQKATAAFLSDLDGLGLWVHT